MEAWEIEIITTNFDKLTKNTTCSSDFLSVFRASKIFTTEDVDELSIPGDTPSTKSSKFYTKIKTRQHGFAKLMDALEETYQSGAINILKTAITKCKLSHADEIGPVNYEKEQKLGKGSNGTMVFKGRCGGRDVAIKRVNVDSEMDKLIINEINNLKNCGRHENIVYYYGTSAVDNFILIVLELCDTTLEQWLLNKSINISHVEVLRQVTVGLEWLHSKRIVHRDLKPENILLTNSPIRVKISDFGLSRSIAEERNHVSSVGTGTQGWIAPEILLQIDAEENSTKCIYTFESDIFSLGCIYYYVLTDGKHPFGSRVMRNGNILTISGKHTVDTLNIIYAGVEDLQLITDMISQDPQSRPPCSSLLTYTIFIKSPPKCNPSTNQNIVDDTQANPNYPIFEVLQSMPNPETWINNPERPNETFENVFNDLEICYEVENTRRLYGIMDMKFIENFIGNIFMINASSNRQKKVNKFLYRLKHSHSISEMNHILLYLVKDEDLPIIRGVITQSGAARKINLPGIHVRDIHRDINTMLHFAASRGSYNIVKYLINEQGFNRALHDPIHKNVIESCIHDKIHKIDAAEYTEMCKILELIFSKCPHLIESSIIHGSLTPLQYATVELFGNGKQVEFIKFLLKHKPNVDVKTKYGDTVLHCLVKEPVQTNVLEIISLLVEYGADTDAINRQGFKFWQKKLIKHLQTYIKTY